MKSNFHIGHQWRLVAALLLVLPLITVAADQTSKKKGAPKKAVTTPMGNSAGEINVRATRSVSTRKAAPKRRDSGSTVR